MMSGPPSTPLLTALSRAAGWLADRRVPRPLRAPLYRAWAAATGSDLSEVLLPLPAHPSLGAFFVRRLAAGARSFPADRALHPSPVDARVQAVDRVAAGSVLQAKGRPYAVDELLAEPGAGADLDGGLAVTLYLAPHDYHRIHAPEPLLVRGARWLPGSRYSVNPRVLARRERVLAGNERVVLRLDGGRGPWWMVLVGALNVGRMSVVGLRRGEATAGPPDLRFERGDELARFEMGSTVVVLWPAGVLEPLPDLLGKPVRMGDPLARFIG